jgi:hypothetical protein
VATWEENTERRVGIVEAKMDKILDPEIGIYPKLGSIEDRLARQFNALLLALLTATVTVVLTLVFAGH